MWRLVSLAWINVVWTLRLIFPVAVFLAVPVAAENDLLLRQYNIQRSCWLLYPSGDRTAGDQDGRDTLCFMQGDLFLLRKDEQGSDSKGASDGLWPKA